MSNEPSPPPTHRTAPEGTAAAGGPGTARSPGTASRWLVPVLVALAGVLTSGGLGWVVWNQDRARQEADVLRDAQALQASLQSGLTRLEDRNRSVRALLANTVGYDPSILARYDSLVAPRTSAPWRAVAAGPLLRRSERAEVEAWVADRLATYDALDYPPFRIFPDSSPHDEMMPILAVQPGSSRENVFGYDMMSDPTRRRAVRQAMASGLVELTPPVTLTQDAPTQAPSLLLVSAFHRGPRPLGPLTDSVGVVATSFTPSALVTLALERLGETEAHLDVTLVREGREILSFPVYGSAVAQPPSPAPERTRSGPAIRVTALGDTHQWRVQGTLHPWDPVSPTVPGTVLAGLLVTALIVLLLLREQGERARLATELERQGRELQASQAREARYRRSEALGRLTGGIAHDFNNLLGVILGNLDLMKAPGMDETDRTELREQAEQAAERAATLTQSLLTFGRQARLAPRAVETGALLSDLTPILRTSVPESIRLEIEVPDEALWIRVDPVQLESAILNLVVNARDACEPGDAIRVGAGLHHAHRTATAPGLEGPAVRISVIDTGSGMSPDVAAQATDPFFTTKPTGRGTGLGLATAAGFLRQSGGDLEIQSTPGRGTTVHLWIPRIDPGVEDGVGQATGAAVRIPAGLKVLLVEDEDPVRTVLTRGLEERGCRVHAVANGGRALEVLAGPGAFDAVLSDMVMPGPQSGLDVVAAARRLQVPVILMSGYAGRASDGEIRDAADAFLAKPVRLEDLVEALARLVSDRSSSS